MTAGLLEPFDEEEARLAGGDAIIKKPFEASAMLETIRPLVEEAGRLKAARPVTAADQLPDTRGSVTAADPVADARGAVAVKEARPAVEEERVRAAVTVALDAAMPALVDEITEKVLLALGY